MSHTSIALTPTIATSTLIQVVKAPVKAPILIKTVATTSIPIVVATSTSVLDTLSIAKPFVVYIESDTTKGNGIIVEASSKSSLVYILTTAKTVIDKSNVKVTVYSGVSYTGKVIGIDQYTNLALVRIFADDLTAAVLINSQKTHLSDVVFAVGYSSSVDKGIDFNDGILYKRDGDRISASLKLPMFEGGALVNVRGEVVGIQQSNRFLVSNVLKGQISELKAGRWALIDNILPDGRVHDVHNDINFFSKMLVGSSEMNKRIASVYSDANYSYDKTRLTTPNNGDIKKDVMASIIGSYPELADSVIALRSHVQLVNQYTTNSADFWDLSVYQQKMIADINTETAEFIALSAAQIELVKNQMIKHKDIDISTMSTIQVQEAMNAIRDIKNAVNIKRSTLVTLLEYSVQAF